MATREVIAQLNITEAGIRDVNAKIGCEAKSHNPACPCRFCQKPEEDCEKCPKMTKQHKVPRCIAINILNWTEEQLDDPENLEKLSSPCHVDADRKVAKQYEKFQKEAENGKIITTQDVLLFRGIST